MSKRRPRKTSPAPPPKRSFDRLDGLLLFGGALVLRTVGLGWSLPDASHAYSYHPDEIFVLQPALGMLRGDWNPHFFNYGTLYLYLVGIASSLSALVGLSPERSADLGLLYSIGRTVTAVMGAGTVALLYLTCRHIAGRRVALIAAALLSITPLHLVNSHFATVDVPSTFFLVLGAWACAHVVTSGKAGWYVLAGAAMGLATATKYTLGLGIVLVIGAHLLRCRQPAKQHRWLIAAVAVFPLFFLLGNPYALDGLHLREEFISGPNSLGFEMRHMRETRTAAFVGTGSGWGYHALRGLPAALGLPLVLVTIAGVALVAWRTRSLADSGGERSGARSGTAGWRVLVLFAAWSLLFFLMVGAATERFIRYLVPLMPFCAVFAAMAVEMALWGREEPSGEGKACGGVVRPRPTTTGAVFGGVVRPRPTAAGVAVVVALLLTAGYSLSQLWLFVRPDPRDRALAAIHALRPTKVGVQEAPWFRTPPISPYNAGAASRPQFERWLPTSPYGVVVTGWSLADLEREQPDVFTISDLQYGDDLRLGNRQVAGFVAALPRRYARREVFSSPTPLEWLGGGAGRVPPDWRYLKPRVSVYSDWR